MQVINLNKKRVCDLSNDKKIAQIRRGDCVTTSQCLEENPVSGYLVGNT